MRTLFLILSIFSIILAACSSDSAHNSKKSSLTVRISTPEEPKTLDPRQVRDLSSVSLMRMLYEGLYRINSKGILEPAIAQSVEISDDLKKYTFTLREAFWSDGSPLTAYDFEKTWKSILSPNFPAPNAYQLYLINGAQQAKQGLKSIDEVSIKATSPKTLIVELENPAPYFLELTSSYFFFPVPEKTLMQDNDNQIREGIVGNGPFQLTYWNARDELAVNKNPHYYDKEKVQIEGVIIQVLDEHTSLQLFKNHELDWAGSPLSTLPQDAVHPLKEQGLLQIADGAGTHWCRFNTQSMPLNNAKIRKAFALAMDRRSIVEHVTQGNQMPALGMLPYSIAQRKHTYFEDNDLKNAREFFESGLKEQNLNKNSLPKIVLSYSSNDRNLKIAQTIQQQWNKAFGIDVQLEALEGKMFSNKMKTGDYQIGLGSWYADIQDPSNFLEIFKFKDNPTNQTFWQNDQYMALLDAAAKEQNPAKRLEIFRKAEELIIEEMPIAPIFFSSYNFLKNPLIQGVFFSPLGYLDFKEAYFTNRLE